MNQIPSWIIYCESKDMIAEMFWSFEKNDFLFDIGPSEFWDLSIEEYYSLMARDWVLIGTFPPPNPEVET